MTAIEILMQQTRQSYEMTNKLIETVPYEKWDETPEVLETNITWQVGHLILSFNYHTVMCTVGIRPEIVQKMPFKEYASLFSFATNPQNLSGKTNSEALHNHLKIMQEYSLNIISSLSDADLQADLEPTQFKHPIAKTKYEAISWNVQHTMWHCGQIGILKRILGERYDFGIPKA